MAARVPTMKTGLTAMVLTRIAPVARGDAQARSAKPRGKDRIAERARGRKGMEQRKRRLMAEPLCRDCQAEGRVTVATVPDHIVPLAHGGTDTDDNIRCLCADHHAKRTAEQFGLRAPRQRTGADGWPVEPGG